MFAGVTKTTELSTRVSTVPCSTRGIDHAGCMRSVSPVRTYRLTSSATAEIMASGLAGMAWIAAESSRTTRREGP